MNCGSVTGGDFPPIPGSNYDTDSVIFKSVPGLYEPHTSDQIGGMTDELEGDFITEFVSNGAKTYAYTTNKGKQVVKCKGFTLNKLGSDRLTLDAMKHLVTANQDSISVTQDVIRSEAKRLRVYSEKQTKVYTCTFDKRVRQPNHTSIPYGYRSVENTHIS